MPKYIALDFDGVICDSINECMLVKIDQQVKKGDVIAENKGLFGLFKTSLKSPIDGSIANISYLADGSKAFPKERIEIFGGEKTAVIDDFTSIEFYNKSKIKRKRTRTIDKGQNNQIKMYIKNLISNGTSIIDFNDILLTTKMTLDAIDISRNGNFKIYK